VAVFRLEDGHEYGAADSVPLHITYMIHVCCLDAISTSAVHVVRAGMTIAYRLFVFCMVTGYEVALQAPQ
jgi:hypothetical protein